MDVGLLSGALMCPDRTVSRTQQEFFFQAEDGIRDTSETGVQTCALPIYCQDGGRGPELLSGHLRRGFRAPGLDGRDEAQARVLPLGALEVPRALEESERPAFEIHEAGHARRIVEERAVEAFSLHPACERERQADVRDLGSVLRAKAVLDDLELQDAHGAEHGVALEAVGVEKDLDGAFLGKLVEPLLGPALLLPSLDR